MSNIIEEFKQGKFCIFIPSAGQAETIMHILKDDRLRYTSDNTPIPFDYEKSCYYSYQNGKMIWGHTNSDLPWVAVERFLELLEEGM